MSHIGWHYISTLGLILDILGVILLFRFGLPPSVDRRGASPVMVGSGNAKARKKAELYDKISLIALALLVAGFGFQIAGNHPEWFGVTSAKSVSP